ncbi:MAG: glycosyltransferase involved in cell wall biosynthesis [Halieaceae bacterium]|jgi:glycosyltransferase involved in cell wall biosynthesis
MQLIVTGCLAPFLGGGARYHLAGLVQQLRERSCRVETVLLPFQFQPEEQIDGVMQFAEQLDLSRPNGQPVDRVISLQFPGYGVQHPKHIVWLMHQHRAAYELFDAATASDSQRAFRQRVQDFDRRTLGRASVRFANSPRVAERLSDFLQLDAEPLYHPPPLADEYRCETAEPFVFYPSRLESLKRQDLLIEAMALVPEPVHLLLAGTGGQEARFRELVRARGLEQRVRFLGEISESEKVAFYARCRAVCFPTFDEDYGYITLEAMLSGKAVITCTDSGGPLAFVQDGETGRIALPTAESLARAISDVCAKPTTAERMGRAGRARYAALNISWDHTIERLLTD